MNRPDVMREVAWQYRDRRPPEDDGWINGWLNVLTEADLEHVRGRSDVYEIRPLYSASAIASLTDQIEGLTMERNALLQGVRDADAIMAAIVERAFRDGLTYGTNVRDADPDIAWRHSRARATLSTSEGGERG